MNRSNAMIRAAIAAALIWVSAGTASAQDLTLTNSAVGFNQPIGIDFHEPTGKLIMSVNYPSGMPNNLDLVDPVTGTRSQFSALVGLINELKVATVRQTACQGGFAVGEVFTGNGNPGGIVRISSDGTSVQNPWVVLPSGPPGNDLLRGSFIQDRFCAANGDLIVVTGNEQTDPPVNTSNGNIWRVSSTATANCSSGCTLVGTTGTHLEGVTTVPNLPLVYGPLAGRILAGAEDLKSTDQFGSGVMYGINGRIYAFNPNPPFDFFTIGGGTGPACNAQGQPSGCNFTTVEIHPEDLDVIRRNSVFFGVNYNNFPNGRMLTAPAANFAQRCGQILITREFPSSTGGPGNPSGLSALRWDPVAHAPAVDYLTSNLDGTAGAVQQWEHVTFTSGQDCATTITIAKTPDNGTYAIGAPVSWNIVVTDTGPVTALAVAVDDPLPTTGGLTWMVSSVSQGMCSINASQVLHCDLGDIGAGGSATIVVTSTANVTAPQCTTLNNTATASSTNAASVSDPGSQTCIPPGSFTLTKNPKNATYNIGDNISFSMVVTSTGPGTANNVVLNDPLPTLGNLNHWTISINPGGVCTIVANTLNCPFGNLANGEMRSVTVATDAVGGADATACTGAKLNNTATATATGLPTKTDTGDYTCTPGNYTLTKNPKNATYNIGDNINFTMVVTSTGPGTANNVVLNDPLPTLGNLNTWVFAAGGNPSGVCTIVANVLNCPFGNLANGQTRTVVVTTNAAGGANATACTNPAQKLNNTATLTGTGLPTKTDTGDWICQPGSYTLTKNPKNATYNIGDNISFTMVVTSTGPGTANNVVLNDPLPTLGNLNTWVIQNDPSGVCTIASNTLNCAYGNLANGATRTVTVKTNAAGGANATACLNPPQKLNNTATLTGTGLPTKTDTGDYTCTPQPPVCPITGGGGPTCANPLLGSATACTVLETNGSTVTIAGPSSVSGGVCIGPNGKLSMSGSTFVTGKAELASGATITTSGSATVQGGVDTNVDLSSQINAANTAAANAAALCSSYSGSLSSTQTITGVVGNNVRCVQTLNLQGGSALTLTGPAGATFILNVNGTFALGGSGKILVSGGVQPKDVLVNVVGAGSDVVIGGSSVLQGSLIALNRKINNAPGFITGQIVSSKDITISSGGQVNCPCGPVPPKNIAIGPSSMEGAISIDNGDWVNGGYSFKTNFTGTITVSANVTITGACSNGGTDTVTVPLPATQYAVVAGSDWIPTGDANNVLSWEGSVRVGVTSPSICGGTGSLDASRGAVFASTITGVPPGGTTTFRFKYRDPAAKNKPNTNCLDTSDPNRALADVCGASWSATVVDP
jgi:uncharacterized repeat protein (TIGR01451 family)